MEILICGTAAAEAWPAIFCHCDACSVARERGGKDVRSRSGYMIGEAIKIDYGPDSTAHSLKYNLAYERLRHLLVSHSHWDHWVPEELTYRKPGFSVIPETETLNVYGNEKVYDRLEKVVKGEWERHRLNFVPVTPFEPVGLEEEIVATPLRAAHDPSEVCVNWMVDVGGKTFLQAHDTGWWPEDSWEFLRDRQLDVVVMDTTNGSIDNERGHMGCEAVHRAFQKLKGQGSLSESCRFVATHFSHNGKWLYADLEAFFGPRGIEVAYDGMKIPLGM